MYCSACGTLIKSGLNYCNNCGARVDKNTGESTSSMVLQYLAMAIGFVGLGGLGLTVALIAILLKNNVKTEVIVILSILFLSVIFGISFLLIQQLSKLINVSLPATEKYAAQERPEQLNGVNTAQLEPMREPAGSVTETTTRTLDDVFVKRN